MSCPVDVSSNRLGDGPQGHAELLQEGTKDNVVVSVPGEPRDIVNDHTLDAALVLTAAGQELLELRTLGSLADSPLSMNTRKILNPSRWQCFSQARC